MSDPSVLVIGLDAACHERIEPLLGEGLLPNLESLFESGVDAPLETTTPPWTPSAWPSVVTGSRPWTHGVYDFYHYEDGDSRHVSARDVRAPFIWELLSACGHQSVVVNVPVTHPPHEFSGSLVPGYIAPETTECVVDGQRVPLDNIDDSYHIYPRDRDGKEAKLDEYCDLIESRADIAESLATEHPWSFMMVQFQCTDAVFHSMGNDESAIRRVYGGVDTAIGRLLDLADEDTHVFVVSDHGMHRYDGVFHCNTWLRDRGYVETSADTSRHSWNERVREDLVATEDSDDSHSTGVGTVAKFGRKVGVTPRRIERVLRRLGVDDYVVRLLPESVLMDLVDAGEHVDWDNSRAFCRSSASLGIRCNVAGRDPDGVIPAGDFDRVRTEIVEALREVRAPDGQLLFDRVYDRHRVHGSAVANERSAPDIVVRPADMQWEVTDVVRDRTFSETTEFNHSDTGLFVADGECIGTSLNATPSVVDVVPTILALFGIDAPDALDGRVLSELFTSQPAPTKYPSLPERTFFDESVDEDVSETVEDQLRELGYIE